MNRRSFLKNVSGLAIGAVAMLTGGCHWWGILKEELSRSDEMFVQPFRRHEFFTWNINAGLGLDGKRDLARIAEVIKKADLPVVALQEIDRKTKRADGEDQFEQLEKQLEGKGHWCHVADREEGEVGMALFLKDKSAKTKIIDLPGGGKLLGVEFPQFMAAVVSFPAKDEDRIAALTKISGMIEANRPFFLLGDWGEEPDSEFMLKLRRSFSVLSGFTKTYPADEPESSYDHIAVSQRHRMRFGHVKFEVLDETVASDHRPVVVSVGE